MSYRPLLLLAATLLPVADLLSQVPTKCFEIESILVDACNPNTVCPGSSEGQNEMVRFRTGPLPLGLVDITVSWPVNPWRGFIQTPQTANLTAQLNASIVDCGWLIEPPNGIIPPGSVVILVGSVDMCPAANSFANLTDTVYLTFQATGNLQNHFPNHNNPTGSESPVPLGASVIHTLTMTHVPTACHDTVSYDRSLLVNQNGNYGGNMLINNGAAVDFTWPGVPVATYYNNDCQAPVNPLLVSAGSSGPICDGGTVTLTGLVSGSFSGVVWQGGTGTFSDPNALVTTYTAGGGDAGTVVLQLCVTGACDAEQVCVDVLIEVSSGPELQITADGPLSLCPGETITLTATGADSYDWGAEGTGPSIVVTGPGTYTVTGSTICGDAQATVVVTSGENVTIQIDGATVICPGQQIELTASGAEDYLWSTNETTATITVTGPGTYAVTGSTGCGSGEASIEVVPGTPPTVSITGPAELCVGQQAELTAAGADDYLWNTSETTATITVTGPGTYSVTGTDACGADQATIIIAEADQPNVTIAGDTELCDGPVQLTASGADTYLWNTNETTATITVTEPGVYTVTGTSACGSDMATITVNPGETPLVTITGDTEACMGATVQLTASGADTYLWSTEETTPTIGVTETGTYQVVGTTACGEAQATISVNFLAAPEASILGDPYLCPVATLTAVGDGEVLWSTGETENVIIVTGPGTIGLTISGTCGTGTASIEVVESPLTLHIGAAPVEGIAPLPVQFTSHPDPADATVLWEFGDGTFSSEQDPQHVYTEPGEYTVLVTADAGGCVVSTQTVIIVHSEPGIDVPNVFSPNGDGQNDVFQVATRGIESMELSLFNRWGQLVYSMQRTHQVWDGRSMAGEHVPEGTYFYVVDAMAVNGEPFSGKGHVTVVR